MECMNTDSVVPEKPTFLGSDVLLRTLGLIRELKAFKFERAALALDFKG